MAGQGMYNINAGECTRIITGHPEGLNMKKTICALLLALVVALSAAALADGARLTEAVMIYEDYDGNRAEQTIDDETTLTELEWILERTAENPAKLQSNTMNSTLLCMLPNGSIYDFAIATDGSGYITDMTTDKSYLMDAGDLERFWDIFDVIQQGMGYDASLVLDW